jgi:hypothetical protein
MDLTITQQRKLKYALALIVYLFFISSNTD